ncbi:MAG: efflux RND transporter periplasmic adaptor subunit [Elusimicrobia bacterium]|nr:efflux RND transporter periplasmic adaptor subunit [Elusimicrobiota bacterium]
MVTRIENLVKIHDPSAPVTVQSGPIPKRPRRNWKAWTAGVVLLAAAAGGGFWWWKKGAKAGPSAQDTATIKKGDILVKFSDSGELAPKNKIDVASKVSGRITELMIQEGQRVKQGDRLAIIQPGRTEAERYVPFTLTAPLSGVAMRYQKEGFNEEAKMARLGDYVTGLLDSTQPSYLLTIGDLSQLKVVLKISEMDILKLKEGMQVGVSVDAIQGAEFPSRVTLVSPQADRDRNDLKTFRVEVTLDKADPRLKPGMTARVSGMLDTRKGVVKIPLSGVFEEMGEEFAYRRGADGKPAKAPLKLGLRNETDAEVLDGVKEGDVVLTEKPPEEVKK